MGASTHRPRLLLDVRHQTFYGPFSVQDYHPPVDGAYSDELGFRLCLHADADVDDDGCRTTGVEVTLTTSDALPNDFYPFKTWYNGDVIDYFYVYIGNFYRLQQERESFWLAWSNGLFQFGTSKW